MTFGDGFAFEKKEVIYFFVELAESLEVFGIFNLMVCNLISVFTRIDGFVLIFSLFANLRL